MSFDFKRYGRELRELLVYASNVADEHRSECISCGHLLYAALILNGDLAAEMQRIGVTAADVLRVSGQGERDLGAKVPLCATAERAFRRCRGSVSGLLVAAMSEDPSFFAQLCNVSGAQAEQVLEILSNEIPIPERTAGSAIESRSGDVRALLVHRANPPWLRE